MRDIDEIIVHCSATRPDWMADSSAGDKVSEIKRWHVQDNGWSDIGYHFIIDRSGIVVKGRPLDKAGAHVRGRNSHSVGICLIGGFGGSENDKFTDNFTPEQATALRNLIDRLKRDYPTIKVVSGHNQYAAKACPCFNVPRWLDSSVEQRTSPAQSRTVQMSGAQMLTGVTGGVTAIAALDGTAQMIVIIGAFVVIIAAAVIMKERLKKWAAGHR
jgi:hypothetical protein